MDGLEFTTQARARLRRPIPALILTGDISTAAARDIALGDCAQLNKPVRIKELRQALDRLLPRTTAMPPAEIAMIRTGNPVIHVVDDDPHIREVLREVLEEAGLSVADFATAEAFLDAYRPGGESCLLIDAALPGMSGLDLLQRLTDCGHRLPAIMITGNGDVPMAVQAIKAGATDFIEKPVGRDELLTSVWRALEQSRDTTKAFVWHQDAAKNLARLTPPTSDHGHGPGRPPQQEHRRRPGHQPAHRRKPPCRHHAQDRQQIVAGPGPTGPGRNRRLIANVNWLRKNSATASFLSARHARA